MSDERGKARFTGRLADFNVVPRNTADARLFACRDGSATVRIGPEDMARSTQELWSPAFDNPEGAGWSCPGVGIIAVNNQGLEGATTDGENVFMLRGYVRAVPVTVLRDAPEDRLELIEVEGHPALIEHPIGGYPYAVANLAVIERFPDGDTPGIVVFVERARSSARAIELAAEIMP